MTEKSYNPKFKIILEFSYWNFHLEHFGVSSVTMFYFDHFEPEAKVSSKRTSAYIYGHKIWKGKKMENISKGQNDLATDLK